MAQTCAGDARPKRSRFWPRRCLILGECWHPPSRKNGMFVQFLFWRHWRAKQINVLWMHGPYRITANLISKRRKSYERLTGPDARAAILNHWNASASAGSPFQDHFSLYKRHGSENTCSQRAFLDETHLQKASRGSHHRSLNPCPAHIHEEDLDWIHPFILGPLNQAALEIALSSSSSFAFSAA